MPLLPRPRLPLPRPQPPQQRSTSPGHHPRIREVRVLPDTIYSDAPVPAPRARESQPHQAPPMRIPDFPQARPIPTMSPPMTASSTYQPHQRPHPQLPSLPATTSISHRMPPVPQMDQTAMMPMPSLSSMPQATGLLPPQQD